jgi:hypothetical protein
MHMKSIIGTIALAAAFCAGAAHADPVHGAGFSAVFPCKAKQTSQNVAAGKATIPVVNYNCESGGDLYFLVTSAYPKGFIAKKTVAAAFKDAVSGAALNVRGMVRTDQPIKLGKVQGHDALIDIPSDKAAAHLRVFFVGDKQFQVMVVGAKGHESGKPAIAFLDSVRIGK